MGSNISTIGKSITHIMYVEENQERDTNTTKKQDKIREYTTKEAPMDKNNADSVEEIKKIRKADRAEKLTKTELKEYRKYIGKILWLSQGTRPDARVGRGSARKGH